MTNLPMNNFTFHDRTSTISTGKELSVVSGYQTINIDFETTGTFTAQFESKDLFGDWSPIMAVNLTTMTLITSTSDVNSTYQVDLTGLVGFRVNITSITGTISAMGKVVG